MYTRGSKERILTNASLIDSLAAITGDSPDTIVAIDRPVMKATRLAMIGIVGL